MDLNSTSIKRSSTIEDVLNSLKASGSSICCITDEKNRVIGVMTDGDTRKLIIEGADLKDSIIGHFNQIFQFCEPHDSKEKIVAQLNTGINVLPVLGPDKKLLGVGQLPKSEHYRFA